MRDVLKLAATLCAVLIVSASASAQTQVGRTIIDGRDVLLFSDQSWRFADTGNTSSCRFSSGPLAFCGAPSIWRTMPETGNPDIDAFYQLNEQTFGMIILEGLGRAAGVTAENLQAVVLGNFALRVGIDRAQVPVLEIDDLDVDGRPLRTMVYSGSIDGIPLVFANTLLLLDNHNAQLITYSVAQVYSDAHRAAHLQFLSEISIQP
jgi:hypothetical protein